jgi:acetyl esterase/lipase
MRRLVIWASLVAAVAGIMANLAPEAWADPTAPSSVVIVIHGGGWWSGDAGEVASICAALETPDRASVAPNYTLSMVAPFPAANRELARLTRQLRERGFERVYAVGVSAGGNLAAWLGVKGLVDGFVCWSAPADLTRFDWWRPAPGWVVRRFAPTARKRVNASPALRPMSVPALIIHSRDEWIPVRQARRLRDADPLARLVILPGKAHGRKTAPQALPCTIAWLDSLDGAVTRVSPPSVDGGEAASAETIAYGVCPFPADRQLCAGKIPWRAIT